MSESMSVAATSLDADVVVIGGGPAGIAAATCAAETGRRVLLVDEGPRLGGQIWRHVDPAHVPRAARHWLERLARSGATVLNGTSVFDVAAGFTLTAERDGRPLSIAAARVILATGARERFLPFPGWTLPGVVGAGGAQALLKSGADLSERRAVVAGSGPLLLAVAGALAHAGANVTHVVEQATARRICGFAASLWRSPMRIGQALGHRFASRTARYMTGTWVQRAEGGDVVREVVIADARGRERTVTCDLLCVGYGLVPAAELAQRLGCAVQHGRVVVNELLHTTVPDVWCAGEPTGIGGMDASLIEGEIAGRCAGGDRSLQPRLHARRTGHDRFAARLEQTFALRAELRHVVDSDTIVCRCEDVRYGTIAPGWSAREAKLRTRAGMGACQGRVCGAALEFLLGERSDTIRPPIAPARVSTLIATGAQLDAQ